MSVGTLKLCRPEEKKLSVGGGKSWSEKNLSFGKSDVGWRISPAIPGNVRTFPGMPDRKTAEAGQKPLGPEEIKHNF